MSIAVAGKLPNRDHMQDISRSPHFRDGSFQNESPTPMMSEEASYWKLMGYFFRKVKDKFPSAAIPMVKTNLREADPATPSVVWFGHSSYLLSYLGKQILVDPVFSGHASPLPFMVKAFRGTDIYSAGEMPEIDYLVLTHDHYDHLDFKTVTALQSKVKKVICSLGVGSHLQHWGYDPAMIRELDWWQSLEPESMIRFTALPARHFSGRGLKRGQTFWSSFALEIGNQKLYIGGDSGYDQHFRQIGDRFGGFDIAFLECGQYNAYWPYIHMMPGQTVQAAKDLKASVLMPVHWAKFSLSIHPWNEPAKLVTPAARKAGQEIILPLPGERIDYTRPYDQSGWWEF